MSVRAFKGSGLAVVGTIYTTSVRGSRFVLATLVEVQDLVYDLCDTFRQKTVRATPALTTPTGLSCRPSPDAGVGRAEERELT
jgi:hypothetical protein